MLKSVQFCDQITSNINSGSEKAHQAQGYSNAHCKVKHIRESGERSNECSVVDFGRREIEKAKTSEKNEFVEGKEDQDTFGFSHVSGVFDNSGRMGDDDNR